VRAIILAGGKGTRLRPYTTVLPKPLMPVDGMPILEILLRQFVRHGVDHATITIGHLGKLIKVYFGDGSDLGIKIDYVEEPTPRGTMGPLRFIHDLPEDFIVANGDILTDLSFSDFAREHRSRRSIFTIGSYHRQLESDFGVLETNANGELVEFREKPRIPFQVSMGIYAVNRSVVDEIPTDRPFGFDDLMLRLLKLGQRPHVWLHKGVWLDVGRTEDFERAQTLAGELKLLD
jgi:NDP-sugar pyrophosphorylase family protein